MVLEAILGAELRRRGWTIATAETDTGGLIAYRLVSVPGSSAYVRGGVVAYANQLKTGLLGIDPDLLERHGVVSPECALALAQAVRRLTGADLGLATTGIAGPPDPTRRSAKPVGLAYVAAAWPDGERVEHHQSGSLVRQSNMAAAATAALTLALTIVTTQPATSAIEDRRLQGTGISQPGFMAQ